MWYYSSNNQPAGPVDEEKMKSLLLAGMVNTTTLVWQEGMPSWQPLGSTALAAFVPTPATPSVPTTPVVPPPQTANSAPAVPPVYSVLKPAAQQIIELNDMFKWYWICLIGIIITFGLSAIASVILFYIIIYRCWVLIQDGYARTTPGKAVGYCFIPFYNFYWIFQAFLGLAKDMNAFNARRNLPIPPIDENLAMAYCVLTLCCAIPYAGYAAAVAVFILQIILLKRFKDAAVAMIQYTQK